MRRHVPVVVLVLLALAAMSPGLSAKEKKDRFRSGGIRDRYKLGFGLYQLIDIRTELTFSKTQLGLGSTIRLESGLGYNNLRSIPRAQFHFRFTPRHRISSSVFRLARSNSDVIEEEIEFEDVVFPIGAAVESHVAFTTLNLIYQYAVVKTEKVEVGVNLGVSFLNAAAGFAGEAIVDGNTTFADLDVDFTAPLLVAGAYAEVALRPRVFWNFAFDIFSLKYDQYSGILTNFGSSVEWFPWGHWGLGFELNLFALDVLIEDRANDSVIAFEYRYNGLFFYAAAAW